MTLVPTERSYQMNTHVKYEGPISHQSKYMANEKIFADKKPDKRTDGQMERLKTIYPRSIDAMA